MARHSFFALIASCALAITASAQTFTLQEKSPVGSYHRIMLSMELKGQLHIRQSGKIQSLDQQAAAEHDYIERGLLAGEHGMIGKTARHYKKAVVDITVAKNHSKRTLRENRRLMVAQRTKDTMLAYCPHGPLTREELDLMHHFNSLAVTGLLPAKAVSVGDRWKVENAVVQALCWFDGLTQHTLQCTLVSVNGTTAVVAVNGEAAGIDGGASVELKIDGSFQFDLESSRILTLRWTQNDQRRQGPVSPAMKAKVSIKMTRILANNAKEVSDFALAVVPKTQTPPSSLTMLEYKDPKGRYQLSPSRDWIMVARTNQHLVLRLLDRGELVAQATVTDWPKAETGKHMSAEEFKTAMAETPNWQQDAVQEAKEVTSSRGYWIYRLASTGKLNGQETHQSFYLVAAPDGRQLVLAFTLTPSQTSKLGTRDSDLVQSVVFPALKTDRGF